MIYEGRSKSEEFAFELIILKREHNKKKKRDSRQKAFPNPLMEFKVSYSGDVLWNKYL